MKLVVVTRTVPRYHRGPPLGQLTQLTCVSSERKNRCPHSSKVMNTDESATRGCRERHVAKKEEKIATISRLLSYVPSVRGSHDSPHCYIFFSFHTFSAHAVIHACSIECRVVDPLDNLLPLVYVARAINKSRHIFYWKKNTESAAHALCFAVRRCVCVFSRGVCYRPSEPGGINLPDNSTHIGAIGRIHARP